MSLLHMRRPHSHAVESICTVFSVPGQLVNCAGCKCMAWRWEITSGFEIQKYEVAGDVFLLGEDEPEKPAGINENWNSILVRVNRYDNKDLSRRRVWIEPDGEYEARKKRDIGNSVGVCTILAERDVK